MCITTNSAINYLKSQIQNPTKGLPEDIFLFASSIVPMINVDLLVKDYSKKKTLLSWRDDIFSGTGWHIPGSIIRVKEKIEDRLKKVVETEIFSDVTIIKIPVETNEIFAPHNECRCHFISILYSGYLDSSLPLKNGNKKENDPGYLKWFDECPGNLLPWHEIYRRYI